MIKCRSTLCQSCQQVETSDVEEYCHRCGDLTCFDCLTDEWCESCCNDSKGGDKMFEYILIIAFVFFLGVIVGLSIEG